MKALASGHLLFICRKIIIISQSAMYGESEETRTLDSHIKSVLLYQLSYTLIQKSAHLVERAFLETCWSRWRDLNSQLHAPKACRLPLTYISIL